MKRFLNFLNPIAHLGEKRYPVLFPLFVTLLTAVALDTIFVWLLHDPLGVGLYAIFIFIGLIVYFAFRTGIRGGLIAAVITILYYLYIITSRHYQGAQLRSGVETTFTLGLLYILIAWIIGWLKQTIDTLIEREANERKRLQTVIQQLPVGVLIADTEGRIIEVNKKVEDILGRKVRQGITIGKDTLENATYNNKPVPPSQWPLVQTLATGKSVGGKQFVLGCEEGKRRYIQISATLIHNRKGEPIAAASIMNDVTAQKEMEERKDDFVNMASHELKTPITSMKLYIETLQNRLRGHEDKSLIKMVTGVRSQADRLQTLVNDLLDVSRLQIGRLTFSTETFDLNSLIKQTISEVKGTAKQHSLVFKSPGAVEVHADKFRIYQVLTNLITNAIKYSDSEPTSEITVRVKKERKQVTVSVKDRGIGIPKDQQKKIFDRLYQVNESKEKTFPGLGMGLYISKEIIRHHKGTIWVESEKSKGSTFYFTLPLT